MQTEKKWFASNSLNSMAGILSLVCIMFLFCRWMIASVAVGPNHFIYRWCLCHRRCYRRQIQIFFKMSSVKAETEFQLEDMPLWSPYSLIRFQKGKTTPASQSTSHSSLTKPASPGPSVSLHSMQTLGLLQVPDISPQFHLLPPEFPKCYAVSTSPRLTCQFLCHNEFRLMRR